MICPKLSAKVSNRGQHLWGWLWFVVAFSGVVGLAGCGSTTPGASSTSNGTAAPDSSVATASVVTASASSEVSNRNDLTHEKVISWSKYEKVDDHTLRFFVTSGDPNCYGLRVAVQETAKEVKVATIEGIIPGAPEICSQVGVFATLTVALKEPLGNRHVVAWSDPPLKS